MAAAARCLARTLSTHSGPKSRVALASSQLTLLAGTSPRVSVPNRHLTAALTGLLNADARPPRHSSQHCSPAGPRCGGPGCHRGGLRSNLDPGLGLRPPRVAMAAVRGAPNSGRCTGGPSSRNAACRGHCQPGWVRGPPTAAGGPPGPVSCRTAGRGVEEPPAPAPPVSRRLVAGVLQERVQARRSMG
jgi:hypothetical protein